MEAISAAKILVNDRPVATEDNLDGFDAGHVSSSCNAVPHTHLSLSSTSSS
jgi:hypothetical protein